MNGRIALFLHQPYCSVQSGNGIMRALGDHYTFKIFTRHDLERDFFDDVDLIAFPGGLGDASSFDYLTREHQKRIRKFVQHGGAYLGICMGAYWAGSEYFDILDGVDAVQYLTRPGTDTRRPHAKNIAVTWQDQPMNMFWYDGCALVGDESKFKTVARYANGDPMAIIQNRIGLIGCHPESEPHWYNMYSWMQNKYHHGQHHGLLLNFIDMLLKNNTKNT
jgi:glutamine amidotransferase-like uncharacterized protein